jgi:CBS domain-containing protein
MSVKTHAKATRPRKSREPTRPRDLDAASAVEEIMTRDPTAIRPGTTVAEALRTLRQLDVRHLPVVNEDRELVGMISDRDLRGLPLEIELEGHRSVPLDTKVSELMSSDVLQVEEETSLLEAIDLMLDEKVGALPVVDDRGVLVGIVSYVDLLREFLRALAEEVP